jgi:hypothetical protein
MALMAEERPLFENEEWIVIEDGLEHKGTGYFIDRGDLGRRRGDDFWEWPLHMAEKSWCTMAPFTEAFACAASLYGIRIDADLVQSFKMARREIAAWPVVGTLPDQAVAEEVHSVSDILRNRGRNTISMKPEWTDIRVSVQDREAPHDHKFWRSRVPMRGSAFSSSERSRTKRGNATPPWRAPYGIRKAGVRLVQLLQAAWAVR